MLDELDEQLSLHFEMPAKYAKSRKVIRKVYRQQLEMSHTDESTPDFIVSLSKFYICPIVKDKEVKKVELAPK